MFGGKVFGGSVLPPKLTIGPDQCRTHHTFPIILQMFGLTYLLTYKSRCSYDSAGMQAAPT